jgi:1-deoxy-D-xylulose-5-phosphate synthase
MSNTSNLLHSLSLPEDLHTLCTEQMEQLAAEIRTELLTIGDSCGGHLASNLGVVELTIVMHALFNSPVDKILWDTSHQTYVHKMLTGRLDKMHTIRQDYGLSGFSKITESEHDTFGAGHASTALSASLGVAHARDIKKENYAVISVVGDASFSGGMTFEALNNVQKLNSKFICILNDNNMSISKPVGNMSNYITQVRTSSLYQQAHKKMEGFLKKIPKFGEPLLSRIEKAADHLRDIILDTNSGVMFEEFGFKYLGPVDGHDIPTLMATLSYAKKYNGPVMLHIITKKGKGHKPAESDPIKYHGVSPKPKLSSTPPPPKVKSYTDIFGQSVIDICNKKDDVVVITPAMEGGSGLSPFKAAHPDRFFDVGIAEEHAVTFSAGLARAGVKPILAIYSSFLQRGFDQMVHDICLQKLAVVFALDRAGIVGADGPTHHGVLDFNYMLPVPNLVILAPKDGDELDAMMHWAVEQNTSVSVRYPRGPIAGQNGQISTPIAQQKHECLFDSNPNDTVDICIIGVGSMAWPAYEAAKTLDAQGITATAINLRFVKPLDVEFLTSYVNRATKIIVVEEGQAIGGVYNYILKELAHLDRRQSDWHQIAIPDRFLDHGSMDRLRNELDLSAAGIIRRAQVLVQTKQV